jgi:hypothetical protein
MLFYSFTFPPFFPSLSSGVSWLFFFPPGHFFCPAFFLFSPYILIIFFSFSSSSDFPSDFLYVFPLGRIVDVGLLLGVIDVASTNLYSTPSHLAKIEQGLVIRVDLVLLPPIHEH